MLVMESKKNVRLQLKPDLQTEIDERLTALGMTRAEGFDRLVRWFLDLDELSQRQILTPFSDKNAVALRDIVFPARDGTVAKIGGRPKDLRSRDAAKKDPDAK